MEDGFMFEQLLDKLCGGERYILWTGGWDSTYRMVELSQQNLIVQPIYCIDSYRKSTGLELNAMKKIIIALNNKDKTKARINDIKVINVEDIPENQNITDAYNEIRSNVKLGSQYEWLARLAQKYPKVEIGVEKPSDEDFSGANEVIKKYGKLKYEDDTWIIDNIGSSDSLIQLFGNFSFPTIERTECEMKDNIVSWGYEDVMKLIWFCHQPLKNGDICGFCRPCQQKMESEMKWLLPNSAQKRYKNRKFLSKVCGD
jgi:7-cyano-7-deazaguanine synthase